MNNIGEIEPPDGDSRPQILRIRRRTRTLPQAAPEANTPARSQASELETEPEVIRLAKRGRPSGWDADHAPSSRTARRASNRRGRQGQRSSQRRGMAQGRNTAAFTAGVAMVTAAVLGLAVVAFFFISKSGPFAVVSVPQVQQPPPTLVSAGNTQPANTPIGPTERPAMDPSATPVKLFSLNPPGPNKGQLNLPRGIAQDGEGNFFVVDTENYRVQKFSKAGEYITEFGGRGSGRGSFKPFSDDSVGAGPGGIAVDKEGNVYVADTWDHRVQKFTNASKFIIMWGEFINLAEDPASAPINDYKFYGPRGVAIGPNNSLYVTDTGNKRVLIYDAQGILVRKIESGSTKQKLDANYPFDKPGELNEPIGIAVDPAGAIYVADTRNERIQKFSNDGKPLVQWAVPAGAWAPSLYMEPFLALDGAGNLYATAPTTGAVLKFSPEGKVLGEKKKEGAFTLKTPTGITVTPDGAIYVVDTAANAVVNLGKIP